MTTTKTQREHTTGTDWERVRREAAQDAPIEADVAQEPYDPNDNAAVAAYWAQATIKLYTKDADRERRTARPPPP